MTSAAKWLTLACLAITPCSSHGADTAALAKRLHNAAESSSIDDPSLKPWHLKMNVQLYDAKGKPSEQGTIEEWWTPDASKRIYTTPSYTATEISTSKSLNRTKGQPPTPYLLDAALKLVAHPMMPTEIIDKADLNIETKSFGKVKLDCISFSKPGHTFSPPLAGTVLTACLDPGVDQLRVYWLDPEVTFRNSIGLFQGRRVGIDTYISLYGFKAISQHVEILESKSFDSSIFTPGADLEEKLDDPVWVNVGATTNWLIHKVAPAYPEDAKRNQLSGAVVLVATIGADGHVIDTELVGTPNQSFYKSAVTAVKQWVYTPYLINGVATKMRTTVVVHFHFGAG